MVKLHEYQDYTKEFLLELFHYEDLFGGAIFADPGLGKTLITLETFRELRRLGDIRNALCIAPIDVIYRTWPNEIKKFGYKFKTSIVHGTRRERMKALRKKADIHLINPDGIDWLTRVCRGGWDLLIVDESSLFKNWSAKRTKALIRTLEWFKHAVILTGTPQPNSVNDLYSQIYICDQGESLGKNFYQFQRDFCNPETGRNRNVTYVKWSPKSDSSDRINEAIAPICMRLDEEDHLDLPKRIDVENWVTLPEKAKKFYDQMEEEFFFEVDKLSQTDFTDHMGQFEEMTEEEINSITATNAGAKYHACLSIANGGIYKSKKVITSRGREKSVRLATHYLHQAKVEALAAIHDEIYQKPILVAYQYQHDLDQLLKKFPKAKVIKGGQRTKKGMVERNKILDQWDSGKIPMMLVQPQSLSHGANLQTGGCHICWFGLPKSLEVYIQFNKRLHRQGQQNSVRIYHILADNTIESVAWDRLADKDSSQKTFLRKLKEYRQAS